MSTDIAVLLGELRTDHRNIVRLLDVLEKESNRIYADGEGQLELMAGIMRYVTEYADTVHHPKEDRLYAELRAARPEESSGMGRIGDEHRTLGEHSLKLLQSIEVALEGDAASGRQVVAEAMRYSDLLRKHMRWEETDLFKRLDRLVAEGHGELTVAVIVDRPDPLFGDEVDEQFAELYRQVVGTG